MNYYPHLLLFLYTITSATMSVGMPAPAHYDVIQDAQQDLTILHEACMQGDLEEARRLIRLSAIINTSNQQGETVLHIAARFGQREIMQLLLDCGALVNAQDQDGLTPLCWAAYKSHPELVCLLLNHGALVTLASGRGNTPLHFAVYNHRHTTSERLRTYTTFKMLIRCDQPLSTRQMPQGKTKPWLSLQQRCLRCLAYGRIKQDQLKLLPDNLKQELDHQRQELDRQRLADKRALLALKNTNKVTARDIAAERQHDDVVTFIDCVLNEQCLDDNSLMSLQS